MVTAQGQNMGKVQKTSKKSNVKKCEKLKYNFDVVNLRINKCLKAKLLKFNMFLHQKLTHHYQVVLHQKSEKFKASGGTARVVLVTTLNPKRFGGPY